MTIKEIEEASGMQRANIRYYEAEGFLHPEREKNGYRNYTDADLKILKKIKLLRSLHISLEEIKALHQGEQELGKTLEQHIVQLTKQQAELEKSKYVCEKMQRDGATYEKLNTEQYLLVLKNCRPDVTEREEWIERDTPEPVRAPFLRIFARLFDYVLYATIWIILVFLWHRVFGMTRNNLVVWTVCSYIIALLLAFLLEPLLLHWFGTTPGKCLLGLRVNYDLGGPIPMDMAWARSWRAILGVHDWKYHDIFQIINTYEAMAAGKPLDWDYVANTTPELKEEKAWRPIVFAAATICCVLTIAGTCQSMRMLPNRGDVTTAEFVENFNTLQDVVYNGGLNISKTGEWTNELSYITDKFSTTVSGETREFKRGGFPKKIDIVEENGVVTEVGFFYETKNRREYLESFQYIMLDIAYAFVEGEQNYNIFTYNRWKRLKTQIEQAVKGDYFGVISLGQIHEFNEFSCVVGGVELACEIEMQGYEIWQKHYVAKPGEDTYYSVRFSAKKTKN